MNKTQEYFVACAPGTEALLARELTALNLPSVFVPDEGGLAVEGFFQDLLRMHLHLRLATRIVMRVARYEAASFRELLAGLDAVSWPRYIQRGAPVVIRASCAHSRLYHEGSVEERVRAAIGERIGAILPAPVVREHGDADEVTARVALRIVNNQVTISVDASGGLLYRRGYKADVGRAPLRETMAAALLMAARWAPGSPLVDPFCGSGTILLEAAQMAAGMPPGARRTYAFMQWPEFREADWCALCDSVRHKSAPAEPLLHGSDNHQDAVAASRANAERAGLSAWVALRQQDVRAVRPPAGEPGWIVTNPPYGVRVGRTADLTALYADWGSTLRTHFAGWRLAFLCPDQRLVKALGVPVRPLLRLPHGGLSVNLYSARL